MLKVIFGVILLIVIVQYFIWRKRESSALSQAKEKLSAVKSKKVVLGVRSEVVDELADVTKLEKEVTRKEKKYE